MTVSCLLAFLKARHCESQNVLAFEERYSFSPWYVRFVKLSWNMAVVMVMVIEGIANWTSSLSVVLRRDLLPQRANALNSMLLTSAIHPAEIDIP